VQIPKAQKDTDDKTVSFAYLGSACVKAVCKTLIKLTPGQYYQPIGANYKCAIAHCLTQTVSPTKLCPTLPGYTTSYD